jgi:hypothetical protein
MLNLKKLVSVACKKKKVQSFAHFEKVVFLKITSSSEYFVFFDPKKIFGEAKNQFFVISSSHSIGLCEKKQTKTFTWNLLCRHLTFVTLFTPLRWTITITKDITTTNWGFSIYWYDMGNFSSENPLRLRSYPIGDEIFMEQFKIWK